MELQTERLLITSLSIHDANFILELVNTAGWLRFIGDRNINSNAKAQEYIQAIINNPKIDYRVVCLKASKQPIGIVTFIQKENLAHPDIGFALLSEFEKNGYAEEATICVLTQLASADEFTIILAVTDPENDKSIKLLQKLGLAYSHEIEVNQQSLNVYEASADLFMINDLCNSFFNVFNNSNGKTIHLDALKSICVAEIVIYTKKGGSYVAANLPNFITARQKILTDGTLMNFQEKEVYSKTIIQGNVAQRQSEYQKSGELNGTFFTQSGSKMFQFIKNMGKWKICSVIWEDAEAN